MIRTFAGRRVFEWAAFIMLGGCNNMANANPCETVFDPLEFDTDADALNYLERLIPAGSPLSCVDSVMSSPKMVQKQTYKYKRIYRESDIKRGPTALGLNSRIVIINHDGSRVTKVEVN